MSVQDGTTSRSWSISEIVLAMLAVLTAAAIRIRLFQPFCLEHLAQAIGRPATDAPALKPADRRVWGA
jgi:hypothetical protein